MWSSRARVLLVVNAAIQIYIYKSHIIRYNQKDGRTLERSSHKAPLYSPVCNIRGCTIVHMHTPNQRVKLGHQMTASAAWHYTACVNRHGCSTQHKLRYIAHAHAGDWSWIPQIVSFGGMFLECALVWCRITIDVSINYVRTGSTLSITHNHYQ